MKKSTAKAKKPTALDAVRSNARTIIIIAVIAAIAISGLILGISLGRRSIARGGVKYD